MTDAAPYEYLAKMIERELELAGQGRLQELQAAVEARGEYVRSLPTPAPPAAQAAVQRANALHCRVIIETERARDGLAISRASLRRADRVARTYSPPPSRRWQASA